MSDFRDIEKKISFENLNAGGIKKSITENLYEKGLDAASKSFDDYTAAKGKFDLLTSGAKQIFGESNPILIQTMSIAKNVLDIGSTIPFVAPIFSVLQVIISIEAKAREADAKCNNLLERINFMVQNLEVLKKVKLESTVEAVVNKMAGVLEDSASLIKIYRKQNALSRRLNTGNKEKFVSCCKSIEEVSKDLMFTLQIQQTSQISVITNALPKDSEDEEAEKFLKAKGGFDNIKNNPELIAEFAKNINVEVPEGIIQELNQNIGDMLQKNNEELSKMLKGEMSSAVADGLKDLAATLTALEKEQILKCVQCDADYREATNAEGSCNFHSAASYGGKIHRCCGKTAEFPCQKWKHTNKHHNKLRYGNYFQILSDISNYSDTVDTWETFELVDYLQGEFKQEWSLGKLLRWKTRASLIHEPILFLKFGNFFDDLNSYYMGFITVADLAAIQDQMIMLKKRSLSIFDGSMKCMDYFTKAEWVLDSNNIVNIIRVSAKVTSFEKLTIHEYKFNPANFELIKLENIQQSWESFNPKSSYNLPKTISVGGFFSDTQIREPRTFKTLNSSEFPIIVLPDEHCSILANSKLANYEGDFFNGKFAIFNKNPTEAMIISKIENFYRYVGVKEYTKTSNFKIESDFPLEVPPKKSVQVEWSCYIERDPNDKIPQLRWWDKSVNARHRPLRLKFLVKGLEGDTASHVLEYVYKPYKQKDLETDTDTEYNFRLDDENLFQSYIEKVKVKEFGNNDTTLVEFSKINCSLNKNDLDSLVFKGKRLNVTEVEIDRKYEDSDGIFKGNLWALIDTNCQRVYAIKVLITQGSFYETKTKAVLGYIPIPNYASSTKTKEIKLAEEKIQFPILKEEEKREIITDDEFDDVEAVTENVKSVPGSVSSNVAGVGGIMNQDLTFLDKRLENIENHIGRTADALETLVGLLKKIVIEEVEYKITK
ncbi:hypothetical protein HK099_008023 [Clydaea vesicula]|uniref:Mixed lineage kinase domain-containing protein n=1 Tax=Clydaea vesicula TaxID=447962 RepID=A0AAD5U6F3_9FUNG|nr:hypothetical protein HK099_008023 [Clydaea vesicula]